MTSHIIDSARHSIWIIASTVLAIAAMVVALSIYQQHQADLAITQLQIVQLSDRVEALENSKAEAAPAPAAAEQ